MLCGKCQKPARYDEAYLVESGLDPSSPQIAELREGDGCEACDGTGFIGRTAVAEVLDMSDRVRQLIVERRPVPDLRAAAREEGMRSLREAALEKVFAGLTTLREINKVTFSA